MLFLEFGENMKKLRQFRGITQKQLGEYVGLSKAVVSKYENALAYPSYDVLLRIAKFFGVTTDYLLGASESKTVNVSGLTDSQIDAIHRIIAEFNKVNKEYHQL